MNKNETVAGIDVGGPKKGFHLVILRGADIVHTVSSTEPALLHERCLAHDVRAVGIDAPSQWGIEGSGREAERALARERISCFATPTQARAQQSTSGFYDWMFNGARVYAAFSASHPVLKTNAYSGGRASFETFPHAITCAFLGRENASAKLKRAQRRQLIGALGIDTSVVKSIDFIDAALCAIAAQRLIEGTTKAYGDAAGGFIFVPDMPAVKEERP
jgi:predicted nuclease with RNAse H fold